TASRLGEGRLFRRRRFPAKLLYPLKREWLAKPAAANFVLIGQRSPTGKARIAPTEPAKVRRALLSSQVIGLGLAQMREHMLRVESLPELAQIAASRLRETIRL